MSGTTLSFIVFCEKGSQAESIMVRVVGVESGEGVRLQEGSFLLRYTMNSKTTAQRCLIRHVASGREAYLQVGRGLRNFIKDCLLDTSESSGHA